MDHDRWWRDLRVAIGAGDADGVVPVLEGELPTDGLQLAGDGLLLALDGGAPAIALSRRCAEALDERSWDGDVELASALRAAMGETAAMTLSSLPVDLDELADVLEGPLGEADGRLDLRTGEGGYEPHRPPRTASV